MQAGNEGAHFHMDMYSSRWQEAVGVIGERVEFPHCCMYEGGEGMEAS